MLGQDNAGSALRVYNVVKTGQMALWLDIGKGTSFRKVTLADRVDIAFYLTSVFMLPVPDTLWNIRHNAGVGWVSVNIILEAVCSFAVAGSSSVNSIGQRFYGGLCYRGNRDTGGGGRV